MTTSRPRAAGTLVALAGLVWVVAIGAQGKPAVPPERLVVEDWSEQPTGHVGIPVGWQGQSWGRPRYDFKVEETPGAGGSGKMPSPRERRRQLEHQQASGEGRRQAVSNSGVAMAGRHAAGGGRFAEGRHR